MPYQPGSSHWTGSRFPGFPLDYVQDEQVRATIARMEACKQNGQGVLLYGPPGTGKTTLMAFMALKWGINDPTPTISNRIRSPWLNKAALWATVQEYVEDVNAEIKFSKQFEDWGDHASASGIARSTPMLFLDDLGAEKETEASRATVESLIDCRYRERADKMTWFTTNLELGEISKRYSQRTLSRLCEMCALVAYDGDDRRLARAMRALS